MFKVLEARSLQQSHFDMAQSKEERAREACDLLLLSLYCHILPGRGLEVRTLEVVHEAQLTEPFVAAHFRNRTIALLHKKAVLPFTCKNSRLITPLEKTVAIEVCC